MLLVKDVMVEEPVCLQASDTATHARAQARDHGFRAFPVLESEKLVGIVTRGDILKVTSNKSNLLVSGIMSSNLVTAEPGEEIFEAAKKMLKSGLRQLPVVEDGKLAGLLIATDILAAFTEKDYNPVKKKVSEVMSTDVVYCGPEDDLPGIWDMMHSSGFSGFPVVHKKQVMGMITRIDLFKAGFRLSRESGKAKAGQVQKMMRTPAITITGDADTRVAAQAMLHNGIIRLPVVDDKKHLIGIVDIEDILNAYVS